MILQTLRSLNITDGELAVLFVGNRKIERLNREYFNKKGPASVISFPYLEDPVPSRIEGDVIVSLDYLESVDSPGLSETEKIFYYVLHGILHVLGYDHEAGEDGAREMRELERKLFHEVTGKAVE